MKIDAMVEREDYYRLQASTLERYFQDVIGVDNRISTTARSFPASLYVYPKINAVVTGRPGRAVRRYVLSEFNLADRPVRRWVVKAYTFACLSSRGLLADRSLQYSEPPLAASDTLIWPCNRKIRIFDFAAGTVDSIAKDGFTDKYFDNELGFRLASRHAFVPPILRSGSRWYRERILVGRPLARITERKVFRRSCREAMGHLAELVAANASSADPGPYAERMCAEVMDKLDRAERAKRIRTGGDVRRVADAAAKMGAGLGTQVPLGISHGDLQTGNLWVEPDNGMTYILDWETVGKRSVWYDAATFLLATRKRNGVVNMVNGRDIESVRMSILANDPLKDRNMAGVMGIILLEDILFYLDDMLELPYDFGADIFDRFGRQISSLKLEE